MKGFQRDRARMVETQLSQRGIRDPRVLEAMGAVARERFLPLRARHLAYRDSALPLESGQTISQPYIVALMTEALELSPHDRVLEVGAGSGYAAAVLSHVADRVDTLERIPELARGAALALEAEGCPNVHVHLADGRKGWPDEAPYDAISVAAAAPAVPAALTDQLAEGGRLVAPLGPSPGVQVLIRIRREGLSLIRERLGEVRFVPLVAGVDDG